MSGIVDTYHGVWENPSTKEKVTFIVFEGKRYTSDLCFGFDLKLSYQLNYDLHEAFLGLSSTRDFNNTTVFLVDDVLSLIYNPQIPNHYKEVILRFALSGVGIVPLIDEVCSYKHRSNKEF